MLNFITVTVICWITFSVGIIAFLLANDTMNSYIYNVECIHTQLYNRMIRYTCVYTSLHVHNNCKDVIPDL